MTVAFIFVAALVVLFFLILALEQLRHIHHTYRDADRIGKDERMVRAALYGRRRNG